MDPDADPGLFDWINIHLVRNGYCVQRKRAWAEKISLHHRQNPFLHPERNLSSNVSLTCLRTRKLKCKTMQPQKRSPWFLPARKKIYIFYSKITGDIQPLPWT
ncbi:hypothetical protein TWF569_003677 [Orbilia oligospora]|uniref:Uncharacterized protein n=1 Tax=Orbilia oligospora TaxID=2813651 RepID=A0A7C8JID1_ORBOL|nr:hypothetical protein TWF103_010719 [Orbilia oligospora]KAF3095410.1 hypothetical protein TWF706_007936 [Orbilia oligospora]KAF3106387.1 hypothetical protein TWF102_001349 [Orbilia oligospora]KAF3130950.1 hypothetical protein TWF594_010226 [Orbilia oligospora]KAF3151537.1 hypothetical protein TWF569_003677 [Orbilia oligospora]